MNSPETIRPKTRAPGSFTQFRNLQELRLFFALSVVVAHSIGLAKYTEWDIIRKILSSEVAVQGFFILSGFLVYGSFERVRATQCARSKEIRCQ